MTNLTEQYRKGELPDGFYWCDVDIYEDGNITKQIESFIHHHPVFYWETSIVRVIELAPSFEEWQTAKKMIAQSIGVCDENTKLKELLKEVQSKIRYSSPRGIETFADLDDTLLGKINQVLGEE